MLKTNSKQARENVRGYIIRNTDGDNYGVPAEALQTFGDCTRFILGTFCDEYKRDRDFVKYGPCFRTFCDWCSGLPSALDTCYYYNRSAVTDLGDILEETQKEREKYSEQEAENLLTLLIWRELEREGRRTGLLQ